MTPTQIAQCMAAYKFSPAEQVKQTEFRCQLVEGWGIQPGQRILEIGCGQGDMTAVLANAVGPSGYVLATDVASENYGAPVSLGESAALLKSSPLGTQIEFKFGFADLSSVSRDFDAIVMAHCSWYFANEQTFSDSLRNLKGVSPKFCFSEWEIYPVQIGQLGHFLSVQFAKLCAAQYASAELNIRNAMSSERVQELFTLSGWAINAKKVYDQPDLADGSWEIAMSLDIAGQTDPDRRLSTLVDAIEANRSNSDSLPIYSLIAERQARA